MTNKTKYIGGPKSKETKAISSRNSTTHGLTARRWINDNEQYLFDESVKEFIVDYEPQYYTEKILIGYETMRRCSEICQFKFEDLQHHGNHKHALQLRHSKTDQYNQGKIIPISSELSAMISSWSLTIDQDSGYILRSFKRNLSTNSSLTPASINHILKSLQKQAGLNQIGGLSGHSFRVGAALDLLDKITHLRKLYLEETGNQKLVQ